MANKIVR